MISESEVVPPNPPSAAEDLFTQVYDRLKAMASRRLAAGPRHTLNTTGLVHELYLRMAHEDGPRFAAQAQFFAYAARAMRHLLMDRARNRLRLRAGGDWVQVTLDGIDAQVSLSSAEEALALDQALAHLAEVDPRAAQVMELRYFGGLSVPQVAEVLSVSSRSVERDWQFARAFLHEALRGA
ncbi:MAG: RNA polymerase sigma factor [Alphaproteobacteria bacterium ADurb.BinA280]|jgi:RNA polymerase sigma factor (TIGR02999 family)|nr:MAG: RNA polymerase sigma factor [Alphaproteobacteria bacterium ADurb.BinA280]